VPSEELLRHICGVLYFLIFTHTAARPTTDSFESPKPTHVAAPGMATRRIVLERRRRSVFKLVTCILPLRSPNKYGESSSAVVVAEVILYQIPLKERISNIHSSGVASLKRRFGRGTGRRHASIWTSTKQPLVANYFLGSSLLLAS
jgi:hypothetical protein